MPRVRDVLLGLVVVAVFGTTARADMMTAESMDIEFLRPESVCGTNVARMAESADFSDFLSIVDVDFLAFDCTPVPFEHFEQTSQTQRPIILTDEQSSVGLCLSALIGLGVCSSAHCLKKLHFGFIPEWYHNGGPFQIGHSLAVNPDTSCPAPVYCFVQPDRKAENYMPLSRLRDIVSLWRQSQYTPDVIASRGPPVTC